ncbi:MAG: hypothetical protein M3Q69_19445 [Acidobacteriota bacterium]|nr:hypothetical protein [Acidobacteriota bacterium]
MFESDIIDRIRHIFLHPRPHVSISQATALLGWTRREMTAAIAAGEVELMSTPLGKWFSREELMAKALETWSLNIIEEVLGDDADRILPHALRTAELRVRLPRYHIAMLEYRAGQDHTTISGVLAKELDGLATTYAEELSAAIPGFAAALAWPNTESAPLPC